MAEKLEMQTITNEPGSETAGPALDPEPVSTDPVSVQDETEALPENQWDEQAEFERLKEKWPEFPDEKLSEVVGRGPAAVKEFEFAAKLVTIRYATKGLRKEADDPIVVLRNSSESDAIFNAQRYGRDWDDEFTDKDGNQKKIARRAGEIAAGDPLAAYGHTSLHIKAGTFFKCNVSLARLLKDKGNTKLEIEAYDSKVHDISVAEGVTLMEDPSMAKIKSDADRQMAEETSRLKGLHGGFVPPEEGRKMAHQNVLGDDKGETFGAPDGDFKKEMKPFSKMKKDKR